MLARIHLDTREPAATAFFDRRGEVWAPRFWLLAADGDVVTDRFGAPIPPMTRDARVAKSREWEVPSVAQLLAVIENGLVIERDQRALLLVTDTDASVGPALAARAEVLESRGRFAEAARCWRRHAAGAGGTDARERLAEALAANGDLDGAHAEYGRLAAEHPKDARAIRWQARGLLVRHGLHDGHVTPLRPGASAEYGALLREAEIAGDVEALGTAHLGLGHATVDAADSHVLRAVSWLAEHRADAKWTPGFQLAAARLAMRARDASEAAAWLALLLERHPTSIQADVARHGVLDQMTAHAIQAEAASSGR